MAEATAFILAVHGALTEHACIETEDTCVLPVVALAVIKLTESCLQLDKREMHLSGGFGTPSFLMRLCFRGAYFVCAKELIVIVAC